MRRYRTEIVIPPDRSLTLQIPASLPPGRATLIVQIDEPHDAPESIEGDGFDSDLDHDDIEWWEEFENDGTEEPDVAAEAPTPPPASD